MRPVSVDDLRPSRDFDLRAFVISVTLGVVVSVVLWTRPGAKHVGPTTASLDDAARVLGFLVGMFVIGPLVALVISRSGGRIWTALATIPASL
jgi:hypothetical protein